MIRVLQAMLSIDVSCCLLVCHDVYQCVMSLVCHVVYWCVMLFIDVPCCLLVCHVVYQCVMLSIGVPCCLLVCHVVYWCVILSVGVASFFNVFCHVVYRCAMLLICVLYDCFSEQIIIKRGKSHLGNTLLILVSIFQVLLQPTYTTLRLF